MLHIHCFCSQCKVLMILLDRLAGRLHTSFPLLSLFNTKLFALKSLALLFNFPFPASKMMCQVKLEFLLEINIGLIDRKHSETKFLQVFRRNWGMVN